MKSDDDVRVLAWTLPRQHPPASVTAAGVTAREWKGLRQFYGARQHRPAWTDHRRLQRAYADLVLVLERAEDDALDPTDYDLAWLRGRAEQLKGAIASRALETGDAVAELELRATAAALRYARDLARGRIHPKGDDWLTVSRDIEPDAVVADALEHGRIRDLPSRLRPPHNEYTALLDARRKYIALVEAGGWPIVSGSRVVRPGHRDSSVPALRRRLVATGEIGGRASRESPALDDTLAAALRTFQLRHGLPPTGVLDAAARRELNVSAADRVRQIEVNIERWRLAPREFGDRYVRVNIPDYYLGLIDHGRTEIGMRVIVGEPDRRTPVLSDAMTHVVLNPYWNIPDSIASDEIAPKLASDPEYLAHNNIELVRIAKGRAEPVDPADQDWSVPLDENLRLRQKPGVKNALGLVKFVFPNHASVYLHDTPADTLFNRTARALSHGCVRVERPTDLACELLRSDGWDRERIVAAMHGESEQWVRLKHAVPVHLMYLTAWVDDSGTVQFRSDIYEHDRRQAAALKSKDRHRPARADSRAN